MRRAGPDAAPPASQPDDDAVLEARTSRLLPGQGELPLGELLGALPDSLPVAAETPSLAMRRGLSPAQFATRVRRALASALGRGEMGRREMGRREAG